MDTKIVRVDRSKVRDVNELITYLRNKFGFAVFQSTDDNKIANIVINKKDYFKVLDVIWNEFYMDLSKSGELLEDDVMIPRDNYIKIEKKALNMDMQKIKNLLEKMKVKANLLDDGKNIRIYVNPKDLAELSDRLVAYFE